MITNEAAKYLWDAQRAAERVARFSAGRSFDDYLADEMLRAAVERQFEIIGEAFVGLRRVDPALAASIPDLSRIIAFRNVLIHAYATVDARLDGASSKTIFPGCELRSRNCLEPRPTHSGCSA